MVVGEGVQRGPPRNRSPLAVSFPRFFSAKRNGVAPQREKPSSCSRLSSPPQRSPSPGGRWHPPSPARRMTDEGVPDAAGDPPGLCEFAFCLFYSLTSPVASGGPISLDAQRNGRKKTAKGNLSRRRFPLESFPIGQGAAAPLRSPGVYGGRGTRDGVWTGKTDCHSRCAHRLRNDRE